MHRECPALFDGRGHSFGIKSTHKRLELFPGDAHAEHLQILVKQQCYREAKFSSLGNTNTRARRREINP
jgi:hypothetical protein